MMGQIRIRPGGGGRGKNKGKYGFACKEVTATNNSGTEEFWYPTDTNKLYVASTMDIALSEDGTSAFAVLSGTIEQYKQGSFVGDPASIVGKYFTFENDGYVHRFESYTRRQGGAIKVFHVGMNITTGKAVFYLVSDDISEYRDKTYAIIDDQKVYISLLEWTPMKHGGEL